ncbi:hypothetical protein HMN09_00588700 [Mycena chlorophos]|uniref:Uncharacterized protein n=1 Tax=Mycena chlorophos TaxID=658473 RepID=A0A8H6T3S2_MYCCL|nr:hypothetical protein HMN09_00588700 [Mycena chlorophos]
MAAPGSSRHTRTSVDSSRSFSSTSSIKSWDKREVKDAGVPALPAYANWKHTRSMTPGPRPPSSINPPPSPASSVRGRSIDRPGTADFTRTLSQDSTSSRSSRDSFSSLSMAAGSPRSSISSVSSVESTRSSPCAYPMGYPPSPHSSHKSDKHFSLVSTPPSLPKSPPGGYDYGVAAVKRTQEHITSQRGREYPRVLGGAPVPYSLASPASPIPISPVGPHDKRSSTASGYYASYEHRKSR